MKNLKTQCARLLIVFTLLLPWAATDALETFEQAGVISSIGYDKFTLRGKSYRLAPGAKLDSKDQSRKKFSDFKKGDRIYFKGKVLNNVRYVDIIYYETPDES